jgi:hypothetical protein
MHGACIAEWGWSVCRLLIEACVGAVWVLHCYESGIAVLMHTCFLVSITPVQTVII